MLSRSFFLSDSPLQVSSVQQALLFILRSLPFLALILTFVCIHRSRRAALALQEDGGWTHTNRK